MAVAYDYVRGRQRELGLDGEIDHRDYHVQIVDLLSSREGAEAGVPFSVALYSAIKSKPVMPGPVIVGQITIHAHITSVRSLADVLQAVMDNGAKLPL